MKLLFLQSAPAAGKLTKALLELLPRPDVLKLNTEAMLPAKAAQESSTILAFC
ncbi:MAG TPA: hypothetical protein VJV58_18555 [Bradyrhizobium sp.]|jgi:hypothetical protein|uniref:hypothetical protein n=1 Tax=Bradyrhizobium sp. TaxID=376 RepID=UPI002B46D130|nr:hypothetical protein [Bradyrhizobium sp.]HKO72934.1 hypothetical protein [Bradyrhizobium sp.]